MWHYEPHQFFFLLFVLFRSLTYFVSVTIPKHTGLSLGVADRDILSTLMAEPLNHIVFSRSLFERVQEPFAGNGRDPVEKLLVVPIRAVLELQPFAGPTAVAVAFLELACVPNPFRRVIVAFVS